MDLESSPWSSACGHKLPEWPTFSVGDELPSLGQIVKLHYNASPQLRQISRCKRCFYDTASVEHALFVLSRSMSMLEMVQSNYHSATKIETTTSRPQQENHHHAPEPSMPAPSTKSAESVFTIGEYTLRGAENELVAKHVMDCLVSDIGDEVEDLRQRMDAIWASDPQTHTQAARKRMDTVQRIEQMIEDLLGRTWAAVGRSKLGL